MSKLGDSGNKLPIDDHAILAVSECRDGGRPLDIGLWILQALLALAFVVLGSSHAFRYDFLAARPMSSWVTAVGRGNLRIIGILEILAGIGLILPPLTGILPWLAPLAAAMLGLVMIFAIAFHARRREMPNIVLNAILGVVALVVAVGRFFIEPF
jgi:uncharacterized membrane protein YphA (DoxX/SURF4 family)